MTILTTIAKATAAAATIGAAVWAYGYATAPAYDGNAGIAYGSAYAPIRDTDVDFHIWYPADPGGRAVTVGGNGVFFGTAAGRKAPHRAGRFPMVIMSHGAGGNAGQFGWIAQELAAAGYVVVLPNHPGTTSRNASAQAAVRVWERPADVSAVIDAIVAAPKDYPFIDTDRIAALGFSAGGYTAMAVSGARVDPDALQSFCDDGDHGMSDCAFLERGGVDLHAMDLSPAAQDLRDPRIGAAVVVDPGIVETMTADSLTAIEIPMLVINLGAEDTIPIGVYARPAAEMIPHADYTIVDDAIHFSFLAECKPAGAAILANEGEPDPLCDDAGGQPRSDIHAELKGLIVDYLDRVTW
ncbi:alpha/beta hydrolase family protein [Yoonia sp. 208BN28-4]|uniref:alpha/beta hydrolase family protein n=1 Tax=Yoonia sp. 208BN28-4 TaxID=3126505 RepID=UPI0030AD001F